MRNGERRGERARESGGGRGTTTFWMTAALSSRDGSDAARAPSYIRSLSDASPTCSKRGGGKERCERRGERRDVRGEIGGESHLQHARRWEERWEERGEER